MSSYGYAEYGGYGYGGYGYGGYGGYGYEQQLGPAYFRVSFLEGYLDGPGTGGYYDSGTGLQGSIYENASGGISQQVYTSRAGYAEDATSYSYSNSAYGVRTYTETVSDPSGLPFEDIEGQSLSGGTSGYFYRSVVTDYGSSTDSVTATTFGISYYENGSYRSYDLTSSYDRNPGGGISGTGSSSYVGSYYDATTGYLTTYR